MKRLLVVEGNTAEGIMEIARNGRRAHSRNYAELLRDLDESVECEFAQPSEEGIHALPEGTAFADFEGAVLTGSPLHAYADDSAVLNQLRFAELLYASGIPIFGSCWGLQIMTRALGGRIRKNPKGREVGIAKGFCLNEAGRAHPMYVGKTNPFECFTVHLDEVEDLAPGSTILAHNKMSAVQAASIETGGGRFWGVQYHPEFNKAEMTRIFNIVAKQLVDEGTYENPAAVDQMRKQIAQGPTAFDRIELRNWLSSL